MLAKAPWTIPMVCVHIRQAAIYAISQGWFVNAQMTHGICFGRAELALAAGTFLGGFTPNLPDGADQPLFLLIQELPHNCAEYSPQVLLCANVLGGRERFLYPLLLLNIRGLPHLGKVSDTVWRMTVRLFRGLSTPGTEVGMKATVHVMMLISLISKLAHGCMFPFEGLVLMHSLTSPPLLRCCRIPPSIITVLPSGASFVLMLKKPRADTIGFLKLRMNRKTIVLYDSLHGFCPVTVETSRRLEVTGILLVKSQPNNPVLKRKELELRAGKPVHKERQSVPIAVKSRLAWLRSTQQNVAGSSNKVKKATEKRTVTDQASLGKFFDKAKNQNKTKTKVKARVNCPTKSQDATNFCAVAEYGGNSEKTNTFGMMPPLQRLVLLKRIQKRESIVPLVSEGMNLPNSTLRIAQIFARLLILTRLCPEAMKWPPTLCAPLGQIMELSLFLMVCLRLSASSRRN